MCISTNSSNTIRNVWWSIMAQHRAGKSRLQKCHGCKKDFNAKDKQKHIMEIIKSLRV